MRCEHQICKRNTQPISSHTIDLAIVIHNGIEHLFDLFWVGTISWNGNTIPTESLDLIDSLLGFFLGTRVVVDDYLLTIFGLIDTKATELPVKYLGVRCHV